MDTINELTNKIEFLELIISKLEEEMYLTEVDFKKQTAGFRSWKPYQKNNKKIK